MNIVILVVIGIIENFKRKKKNFRKKNLNKLSFDNNFNFIGVKFKTLAKKKKGDIKIFKIFILINETIYKVVSRICAS